eukprot:scpid69800/ scgid18872/ 
MSWLSRNCLVVRRFSRQYVQAARGVRVACSSPCNEPVLVFSKGMATSSTGVHLGDVEDVIAVLRREKSPRLEHCLHCTSLIFELPGVETKRKKILLDNIVHMMARSSVDVLEGKPKPEFYVQMKELSLFYQHAGEISYIVDTLQPLALNAFTLLDGGTATVSHLKLVLKVITALDLHRGDGVAKAVAMAKPRLFEIVERVDMSDIWAIAPLMELIFVVAEAHKKNQSVRGWDIVELVMTRLEPMMTSYNMLQLPRITSGTKMGVMLTGLRILGLRKLSFLDAVAQTLVPLLLLFPADKINWFGWSHDVMYAYSHLCVPAPKLAEHIGKFIEQGSDLSMNPASTGCKVVCLCWALVCQGCQPPSRLLKLLESVVDAYLSGTVTLGNDVHKLPHILFLLPFPLPRDQHLLTRVARDVAAESRLQVGLNLGCVCPHMITNRMFPDEGLVTALGVFDHVTCDLVPYPSELPCPSELNPRAVKTFLRGNVGVIFLDIGPRDFLHPPQVLSGQLYRKKWLLEQRGWLVCTGDGMVIPPAKVLKLMQMTARLDVLETKSLVA